MGGASVEVRWISSHQGLKKRWWVYLGCQLELMRGVIKKLQRENSSRIYREECSEGVVFVTRMLTREALLLELPDWPVVVQVTSTVLGLTFRLKLTLVVRTRTSKRAPAHLTTR